MAFSLPAHITTEKDKTGYDPRIGVEIAGIKKFYSRSKVFDAQIDSGADGVTTITTVNFSSATGDFVNDEVVPGDILIITGGSDDGEHTIATITDANNLTVSVAFAATDTGLTWRIVRRYADLMSTFPQTTMEVDHLGGVSKDGGMSFSVLNQELESDVFDEDGSYPNPQNEEVIAKLFFDDGTTILMTESVKIFTGLLNELPPLDYRRMSFQVDHLDAVKYKKIGTLLTGTDAADGEGGVLPAESKGKIKPIVYGDHRHYVGNVAQASISFDRKENMTPMVYLGIDNNGYERWLVSGHKAEEIAATDQVWGWDPALNRMVRLITYDLKQNTAAGCILAREGNSFEDFWFPDSSTSGKVEDAGGDGSAAVTDEGNMCDRDNSTLGTLVVNDSTIAGVPSATIRLDFPTYENKGTIGSVKVYARSSFASTGGAPAFTINADDATADVATNYEQHGVDAATEAGAAAFVPCIVTGEELVDPAFTHTATIYMCYKKITYVPTGRLQLYFAGQGREYGTWVIDRESGVDSDPEGNLYTESHADHDGSGDLIENFAGVAESILVDELGLANTNVMENSFNIASNDLSTTKASFAIIEQIDADKFLDEFLQRANTILHFNHKDLARLRTFVSGDPFSISGNAAAQDSDKFLFTPTQTAGSFDEHPIIRGSFSLRDLPNDVVTDFTIKYTYSHAAKEFHETVTVTDNTYHAETLVGIFEHPYTNDQTTAEFWRDHLKLRLRRRFHEATFRTWYNAIMLEGFDTINVQHPTLTNLVSAPTTKKWTVTGLKLLTGASEIEVIAVETV